MNCFESHAIPTFQVNSQLLFREANGHTSKVRESCLGFHSCEVCKPLSYKGRRVPILPPLIKLLLLPVPRLIS
jgi:hypothetical protein